MVQVKGSRATTGAAEVSFVGWILGLDLSESLDSNS